jgi:hypothetical protein
MDKQGSNNIGSVDQSDENFITRIFCHNRTCAYAHHFNRSEHFYLPTHNIQDKILSHYIGSLLWPIVSLLSTAIPIFCKAGSTHFSWTYHSQCKVLFTIFKGGGGNGFLCLVYVCHTYKTCCSLQTEVLVKLQTGIIICLLSKNYCCTMYPITDNTSTNGMCADLTNETATICWLLFCH